MGGASSYLAILAIMGFLSAAWTATKLSKLAGVSSIVLEITTGVVLGPRVLGLISSEYAVCEHLKHAECEVPPDFQMRLDQGLPLGKTLGRIANMDYCNPDDYHHVADGHHEGGDDAGHGDGHGDGGADGGHGGADGDPDHGDSDHGGSEHGDGEGPHDDSGTSPTQPPHLATGLDDEAPIHTISQSAGHEDSDDGSHHDNSHSPTPGHEEEAHGTEHAEGAHRRLSGGGGDYHNYEECLEKSCESDISHHCGLTPDVFTLIGHAGVALMIFESGMHFDFEKAQVVGPKACCVAVLGTILPLITGTLLTMIYGYPFLPDGVAVGTALAPTSVGIALRLLGEAGVLQHDFGQAIITAAFVDDILSLILFNILFSLRGDFDVMATVVNPIIGVIFMGIAMVLAVKFWPNFINKQILPRLPKKKNDPKVTSEDEALFLIMMCLLVVYGTITHFLGTHLWGCFIAGMSFACIDSEHHKGHTHHVWVRQTKRMTSWMIRIFFACTVAFSIPVSKLMSFDAFWKGSIMGIGPCILTKVLCAPFMGNAKFVIGWAMVGRAEFAYLIAQMAAAGGMIDEKTFSICIWALLYATIFAPFVFRTVLNRYIKSEGIEAGQPLVYDEDDLPIEGGEDSHGHHESQTKKQLDFSGGASGDIENTTYGKQLEDLDKIDLEDVPDKLKVQYKKERSGGFQKEPLSVPPATNMAPDGPAPAARRKLWFGRAPAPKVSDTDNGFLCCLFFRKVVLN